jgi:putative ABC transport system substrate-binding protein
MPGCQLALAKQPMRLIIKKLLGLLNCMPGPYAGWVSSTLREAQVSRQRPYIGMFMNLAEGDREISARREAFLRGLGPMPGLTIASQYGAGDFRDYPEKAKALRDTRVDGAGPDLYFATCWPSLRALKGVVGDTPIVFVGVANLRPDPATTTEYGKNVYGFISYGRNLCGEWARLLRDVAPDVARAAVVYDMNTDRPNARWVYEEIAAQGRMLSPKLDVTKEINCGGATLETDLANFVKEADTPAGDIDGASVLAAAKRQVLVKFAVDRKVPVVYPNRLYTFSGGLASKGTYIQGLYRSAGIYARKLLTGERPSPRIDITQTGLNPDPNKMAVFETVINTTAANAIGRKVDPAVLAKADLVIG